MTKKQLKDARMIQEYAKHNDTAWFEGYTFEEIVRIIKQENEVET